MGVVLAGLGFGLLYANLNQLAAVETILKWWPILFILLGIEILWLSYAGKEDAGRVKYDMASIMIVLFIVLSGLTFQLINDLGAVNIVKQAISYRNYSLQSPVGEISVNASIKKAVIEGPDCSLDLFTSPANQITYYGAYEIASDSLTNAMDWAGNMDLASSHVTGDTIFINFNGIDSYSGINDTINLKNISLTLPANLQVSVNNQKSAVKIYADNIQNDWNIKGWGDIYIQVPSDSNLKVSSLVNERANLLGNVAWETTDQAINPDQPVQQASGTFVTGKPLHSIDIISAGNVTVDQFI